MKTARGLSLAFGLFVLVFLLHAAAGSANVEWLFAVAVAAIAIVAAGFPVFTGLFAGSWSRATLGCGVVVGLVLTTATAWAINDRAFAPWMFVIAPAALAMCSAALGMIVAGLRHFLPGRQPQPERRAARRQRARAKS